MSDLTESSDESRPIEEEPGSPVAAGVRRRRLPGAPAWSPRRWMQVLTALLLAAGLTAGAVYWWLYRPDQLTDPAARDRVLDAAREATEALLSYSPDSIDADVTDAKSRLTGDFLERYSEFADTVVAPAAKERGITTEANVARAAVSEMRPGRAQVLVFVNQVTTSKERPTPALATSSVMVTLVNSDGRWLISEFTPI
jgi:Mce-associated membrane protein